LTGTSGPPPPAGRPEAAPAAPAAPRLRDLAAPEEAAAPRKSFGKTSQKELDKALPMDDDFF
jgi:hypothetical protein